MADRQSTPKLVIPTQNNWRIGIVRSRFHENITDRMRAQATGCLEEYNIAYDLHDVAGSYELVYLLQQMAESKKYNGLVALGCLVKGETMHFDVLANTVTKSIMDLIIKHDLPIGFSVLTALDIRQAEERAWLGYDATYAVLDTLIQAEQVKK